MKEFILDLDKPRKLIFDYDAIEKLGEIFGSEGDSQEIMSKMNLTTKTLPTVIAIGLIWEDPELTEETVKKLLNDSIRSGKCSMMDHMELVTSALIYQQTGKEYSIRKKLDKVASEAFGAVLEDPENLASSPPVQASKKKES